MISTYCAICGKKQNLEELYKENFDEDKINVQIFSARRTPDRLHYRLVKCLNCGLIFSNPILPAYKINKLYVDSTFEYRLESMSLRKTYARYLQPLLQKREKERIHLLDIGCGNGFFLEEAKDIGVGFVYGVEPGNASVKQAPQWLQKNIKISIFTKGLFKEDTFDIICCFHTLDHIIDPNTFLHNVYDILKKGGKALFVVHDTEGLSVKLFGEKSPIFDIEHIYLFNKNSLKGIFSKNGFQVLKIMAIKNRYPLNYWFRMTPLPIKIKKNLLFFLEKTKIANIPIALKAGNIGIIVQK